MQADVRILLRATVTWGPPHGLLGPQSALNWCPRFSQFSPHSSHTQTHSLQFPSTCPRSSLELGSRTSNPILLFASQPTGSEALSFTTEIPPPHQRHESLFSVHEDSGITCGNSFERGESLSLTYIISSTLTIECSMDRVSTHKDSEEFGKLVGVYCHS